MYVPSALVPQCCFSCVGRTYEHVTEGLATDALRLQPVRVGQLMLQSPQIRIARRELQRTAARDHFDVRAFRFAQRVVLFRVRLLEIEELAQGLLDLGWAAR